jgi:TP901 family phage tail tape measure protein
MALAQQFVGIGIRFTAKDDLSKVLDSISAKARKFAVIGGGPLATGIQGLKTQIEAGGKTALRAGMSAGLFAGMAGQALTRVAGGLRSFTGDMIKKAAAFEEEVTRIGVASGKSGAYIGELSDAILEVSGPLPTTAVELAKATTAFAKMGFASTLSAKGLAELGRVAVMFGRAINVSDEQASLFLGRLATWVGVLNPTSKDLNRVGSEVARVGFFIKGTAQDVIKATERFGAFAKSIGFSEAQIIALAGHVKDSGILIRRGSTAINRTLQQMVLRTNDWAQAMTEAKVVSSPEEFKKLFRTSPMEAFQKVLKAVNSQWGGNSAAMLRNLGIVGNYISDIITMSKNQKRLKDSLVLSNAEFEKAQFLQDAYDKMAATFNGRLKAMTGAWDNLKITIGTKLLPVLTWLLEGLTKIFNWFQGMHPLLKGAIGWTLVFVTVLTTLGAIAIPILLAVAAASMAAGVGFGTMALGLLKMVAIALIAVAVVAGLIALIMWLAGVEDPFAKIGESVGKVSEGVTKGITSNLPQQGPELSPAVLAAQRTGSIPTMARGGVVDRPTLAVIGEGQEREFVFPESRLAALMEGMSMGGSVHERIVESVTVPMIVKLDGREIARSTKTAHVGDDLMSGRSLNGEFNG